MNRYVSLILFLVLVLGGGLVLSFLTVPGEWYGQLAKAAFNPPGWIFGPVWTMLYVLIAVAGWRVWQRDRGGWPMKLWWAQLALNFLWTPGLLRRPPDQSGARRHPADARGDPRLHRHGVAAGPRGGVAVRALCRVGGVRLGAECLALRVELRC